MARQVAPAAENEPRVMTVPEAAARLGMSPAFVYRLLRERELSSVRIGRNVRVYEDSLEQFIDQHTEPAIEPPAPAVVQRPARRRAR